MAQTPPKVIDRVIHVIDVWYDGMEALLSAQRSLVKFALSEPSGLLPLPERVIEQTTNDRTTERAPSDGRAMSPA